MKTTIRFYLLMILALTTQGLIVRHDVPDQTFIELANGYPQICHLHMGEGVLIDTSWVLTAGHIGKDTRDIGEIAACLSTRVR